MGQSYPEIRHQVLSGNLSLTALANNQLSGYGYDVAGNMTSDATDASRHFDAKPHRDCHQRWGDHQLCLRRGWQSRREVRGGTSTLYWYMTPGIIAESGLAGNLKSEYVFFNDERVARRDFNPLTTHRSSVLLLL